MTQVRIIPVVAAMRFAAACGEDGGPTAVGPTAKVHFFKATTFKTVTSGSSPFTILNGHDTAISGSAATLNLQAGTVNTIAIVPSTTASGFQLVNIPRC